MLASVTLRGPEREAVLVHKDSVVRRNGVLSVFVVSDGNRVEPVRIREGIHSGEYIEAIDSDLVPEQLIVTEGAERLRPFEQVVIQEHAPLAKAVTSLGPSTETGD